MPVGGHWMISDAPTSRVKGTFWAPTILYQEVQCACYHIPISQIQRFLPRRDHRHIIPTQQAEESVDISTIPAVEAGRLPEEEVWALNMGWKSWIFSVISRFYRTRSHMSFQTTNISLTCVWLFFSSLIVITTNQRQIKPIMALLFLHIPFASCFPSLAYDWRPKFNRPICRSQQTPCGKAWLVCGNLSPRELTSLICISYHHAYVPDTPLILIPFI